MNSYKLFFTALFMGFTCWTVATSVPSAEETDVLVARINAFNFSSLSEAILDLKQTYPDSYDRENRLPAKLANLQEEKIKVSGYTMEQLADYAYRLENFKEQALLANPLLQIEKILFIKRLAVQYTTYNELT